MVAYRGTGETWQRGGTSDEAVVTVGGEEVWVDHGAEGRVHHQYVTWRIYLMLIVVARISVHVQ